VAGSVISLGIQVEGEKTFNSAIQAIDAQIKSFGNGIKAAEEAAKALGDSEAATAQKNELLGASIDANNHKLELLSQQYQNAQQRLDELAQKMQEAKASGNAAEIDAATNAYNKQVTVVANLSSKMSQTQAAISSANAQMNNGRSIVESLRAAWDTVNKVMDSVPVKVLAAATSFAVDLAQTAIGTTISALKSLCDGCVQAGKYIFDLTTAAGSYADTMLTIAEQSNVDVVNLQKWEYASQFIDTEVSTITGSLTKLTANMTSESEKTSAAFAQLGISVKDSGGHMKSAETVMWEAIDALGNVANQTERDALAMSLFGESAQKLNPLINAGSEAFRQLGDQAQSAGLIMSEQTMAALGGVDDAMNRCNSTITGLKNTVAAQFAPAVTELTDGFSSVVEAAIGMVNGVEGSEEKFQAAITNLCDTAVRLLNDMLPKILETGVKIITNLVQGIANNIGKITETITKVIRELLQTIVKHLPEILKSGVDILIAIIDGIIQAIPDLAANVPKIIEAIVEGLLKLAPKLLEAGKNIIVGLWEGIKGSISWLWEKIKEALGSVFGWVLDLLGIHSPSRVMRDKVGLMMGLGVAEGITDSARYIQQAMDGAMPSVGSVTAGADSLTVAARARAGGSAPAAALRDNRPIILRLNDRELGRAVREYV